MSYCSTLRMLSCNSGGRENWGMEDRKNSKWKKNKRSSEISSIIEKTYSRAWFLKKREGFRKYKESNS